MRTPDQLRELVEQHLAGLQLVPELGDLAAPVRYAFEAGGKRVRPVICLATGEAVGAAVGARPACGGGAGARPLVLARTRRLAGLGQRRSAARAAAARGPASAKPTPFSRAMRCWARRFARRPPTRPLHVTRELAEATLGMIGGQHLDIHGEVHDLAVLHRLKTGRLFAASVGCALWAAEVPLPASCPGGEFGEELGLLFQIVDDVLDEDGYFVITAPKGRGPRGRGRNSGAPTPGGRLTRIPRCSARSSPISPYAPIEAPCGWGYRP